LRAGALAAELIGAVADRSQATQHPVRVVLGAAAGRF
ncbi:MAG: hypothetical protein JWM53_2577, partial [bacterium]|nr:hypothetical protein [bacterium]